jgi:hypothetical protein
LIRKGKACLQARGKRNRYNPAIIKFSPVCQMVRRRAPNQIEAAITLAPATEHVGCNSGSVLYRFTRQSVQYG